MATLGIIGCGNMGSALANAAAATGVTLWLSDGQPEKAEELASVLGVTAIAVDNAKAAQADYVLLAVKPQVMGRVLADLAPVLAARQDRFVLVSVAAGLSTEKIGFMAGGDYPVIRLMPNTPALIGKGMILCCTAGGVTETEMTELKKLLSGAGMFDAIPESMMDAAGALSGCGPAYAYLYIEALADGAVACGVPRDKALLYASRTLQGAAEMVLRTGQHPGVLKDAVTSPGGTTIEGLRVLEERGLRSAAIDAICAAYKRSLELGK